MTRRIAIASILVTLGGGSAPVLAQLLPPGFDTEPFDTHVVGEAAGGPAGSFRIKGGPPHLRYFIAPDSSLVLDFAVPFVNGPGADLALSTDSSSWGPLADRALLQFFLDGSLQGSIVVSLAPARIFEFSMPEWARIADRVIVTNISPPPPYPSDLSTMTFDAAGAAGGVRVTSPNTTVNWGIGSVQPIEWTHTAGAGARFRIQLSRDTGVTWRTLADTTSAGSSSSRFRWTVDEAPTEAARIRVVPLADPINSDASDVNFTIAAPFIVVSSPGAAAAWTVGTTRVIAWMHNLGVSASADIELSRDGGATWETIADGVRHAGTTTSRFQWVVTGPVTANALLRVNWTVDAAVFDASPRFIIPLSSSSPTMNP